MNKNKNQKNSINTLICKTLISFVLIVVTLSGNISTVSADNTSDSFPVNKILNTDGQGAAYLHSNNPIASAIVQFINLLARLIGSVAFIALIGGGFILMVSSGNENLLTKGKDAIKYAIIGLIVALSAYFITSFVQSIFYEVQK